MIPYRDENPVRRRAVVTFALLVLNIGVFTLLQHHGRTTPLIELPRPSSSFELEENSTSFLYARAAIPCEILHQRALSVAEITRTLDAGEDDSCGKAGAGAARFQQPLFPEKLIWLSVLSSMFLHGDIVHLAGNILFLWLFGNNIEDRWGHFRYLLFYLVGGFIATLGHALAAPASTVPLVGASGAIAAVMGAYLVLFPRVDIRALLGIFPIRVKAWMLLGVWFVSQFFIGPTAGVAWMAHVVGFVFGIVVATVARRIDHQDEPVTRLRVRR